MYVPNIAQDILTLLFLNDSLLILSTKKEKVHNLKVENYVLFTGLSEDFKPGRWPLRLL